MIGDEVLSYDEERDATGNEGDEVDERFVHEGGGCGYGTHTIRCRKGILALFRRAEGGLWVGVKIPVNTVKLRESWSVQK